MAITGKIGCVGKGMSVERCMFDKFNLWLMEPVQSHLREYMRAQEDALNYAAAAMGVPRHISAGYEFRTAPSMIYINEAPLPQRMIDAVKRSYWWLERFSTNKKEQQMNAEMVKACSNDKRQAWCALPSEVREAMKGKPIQVLDVDGTFKDYTWAALEFGAHKVPASVIVRLSPAVKADPEYDIRNASKDLHNGQMFWGCVMPGPFSTSPLTRPALFFPMHEVASMENFAGILYEKDLAWHPFVRGDLGAPLQVRFLKS